MKMPFPPYPDLDYTFEPGETPEIWHRHGFPWYQADPHPLFGAHSIHTAREEPLGSLGQEERHARGEGDVTVRYWCACGAQRLAGEDWTDARNPRVSAAYQRRVNNAVSNIYILMVGCLATMAFLAMGLSISRAEELASWIYGLLFCLLTTWGVAIWKLRS